MPSSVSLFVILYFYPATYRPEGPWQRLCRCPIQDSDDFPPVYPFPTPGLTTLGRHSGGITTSPSPQTARKTKNQRKGKKVAKTIWSPPSLLLHPLGSGLDLHLNLRLRLLPPPAGRPGSRSRGSQGPRPPSPCGGGKGNSTSTQVGGPPSWGRRRQPAPHEGPCSWRTG